MSPASTTRLPEILGQHEGPILERWVQEQLAAIGHRRGLCAWPDQMEHGPHVQISTRAARVSAAAIASPVRGSTG